MSFNGAGTFTRLYSWVTQAGLGTKIRSDLMDTDSNDIASGLSNVICKDGQTTITQNIPFNNKKITGLGAGTLATDAPQLAQVQAGQVNWAAAGGTADALTATYTPAITSLTDGLICYVRASAANATATPTFAPNGLTAHTITKNGGSALVANDIAGAGHEIILRYKLASTIWELMNPSVTPAVAVTDATIATTDVTTNNVTSTKHGWAPKAPADATKFLNGANPPAYAAVSDANLSVTDITTNNVSTSAHGFAPKAPNDATKYLDGTGAYSLPPLKLGTATAFNSAATYAITSLPAGLTEININFQGVTFNATSDILIQIGDNSGALKTSGYLAAGATMVTSTSGATNYTTGFGLRSATASTVIQGSVKLNLVDAANFIWVASGTFSFAATGGVIAGSVTLAAALDRITITTVGGAATWTAGKINISYR